MAQVQSLHTKMLADSRMRDIKRRIEVIQKKVADLQEMGVPCAFCYSSVRNPGSIFTLGDKRITEVIERYRNKILCNLMDGSHVHKPGDLDVNGAQEIHLILPVLPAPLDDLNRATLQSMIVGILKDLDIRWSDPKPVWWPVEIPFVPPRTVPENFAGSWIHALKSILRSVYNYFNYNINTYIASKLESQSVAVNSMRSNSEGSCEDYESNQESSIEASQGISALQEEVVSSRASIICSNTGPLVTTGGQKPPTNKTISSFTVENILMGKQSPVSSSSSSTSSIQSPTSSTSATSLFSPIPPGIVPTTASMISASSSVPSSAPSYSSSSSSSSSSTTSSSIVGVNWVSHPPVKYTKFTILSPTAMSDEAKRKKSSDGTKFGESTMAGNNKQQVIYARQASSETSTSIPTPVVYPLSSLTASTHVSTVPPSSSSSSSSSFSSSYSSSSSAAKICTLPIVTTLQGQSGSSENKVVLSKTFPPSQQYVFLMPSNSEAGTAATQQATPQPVPQVSLGLTQAQKGAPPSVSTGLIRPMISFQTPVASSEASCSRSSNNRAEVVNSGGASSSSSSLSGGSANKLETENSEYGLHLTASKKHTISGATGRSRLRSRAGHKPQKLRFHMTTVVTKQKKIPMKSSMTVESPVTVSNPNAAAAHRNSDHSNSAAASSFSVVESKITRSPNVYSSTHSKSLKEDMSTEAGLSVGATSAQAESNASRSTPQNGLKLSNQNGGSPKRSHRAHSPEDIHAGKKDALENSLPSAVDKELLSSTGHRGRATRSYTRRKRELTFHLYEDPGTTFKAKRACKDSV